MPSKPPCRYLTNCISPTLAVLAGAFVTLAIPLRAADFRSVSCDGSYAKHLQGVCVDDKAIFWSFTTTLAKTDPAGKRLKSVPVSDHHGDLCHHDGKIYVAVNLGKFNQPAGQANSWVYVYDAAELKLISKHAVPEAVHGAGGIGFRDGRFYVVGGLPDGVPENYVYEYDEAFRFVKRHTIASGTTHLGIQTATFAAGRWWFGSYGNPPVLLVTDENFALKGRFEYDCSLGIEALPDGRLLSATGRCDPAKGCTGAIRIAIPDDAAGLKLSH